MSITDELRKYAQRYKNSHDAWSGIGDDLDKIADRIDVEHEAACAEAYGNGVMSVPIALDESAWVELPKDADGEYIHIGDVMENIVCPPVHREVTGVGAECFYGWDEGNGRYSQFGANCYRHYHAPTVEDVLCEFFEEVGDGLHTLKAVDTQAIIAKYAAKLKLAEGVEG